MQVFEETPDPARGVVPVTYHGLTLDEFQRQAMDAILQGLSVLVSAPTGTGKTVIADFLVDQAMAAGRRVVYTAPIKALSNQKFDDYRALFGEERVGLLTGDVSIRPEAPLCIMTTEILRNQLITGDTRLEDLAWVVFDEIHYISSDRGLAWEESIILLPPGVHLLGLSATVPNLGDLAAWIEQSTGQRVVQVLESRRAVPLSIRYVTAEGDTVRFPQAKHWLENSGAQGRRLHHLDLVAALEQADALPALYFVFSRAGTEQRAREASRRHQFLDVRQAAEMELALQELAARYPGARELGGALGTSLRHGIGFHHAGLLPSTKRVVESLYARGLVRLLYCTETFAVGVNYPVRGVALESSRKFDGLRFRPLLAQEFQQMTGRAGRRRMDSHGLALIGVDGEQRGPLLDYAHMELEPLASQFFVTESTVLNLLKTFGRERALDVLGRNFREFERLRRQAQAEARVRELRAEIAELWKQGCPHLGTEACPLVRHRLLEEQALLRQRRRKRHHGRSRKAMDVRLRSVTEALGVAEDCPKTPDPCRPLEAPFAELRERLGEAELRLAEIGSRQHYRTELDRVTRLLERLDYLSDDTLLPRGEVARHLHVEPLLLTELVFEGIFHRESPQVIGGILAGVDYDARHDDACYGLPRVAAVRDVERVVRRLRGQGATVGFDPVVCPLVAAWAGGRPFGELMTATTISEGDFVAAVRRALDLLRQLRAAVREDQPLLGILERASLLLDRDEARVVF